MRAHAVSAPWPRPHARARTCLRLLGWCTCYSSTNNWVATTQVRLAVGFCCVSTIASYIPAALQGRLLNNGMLALLTQCNNASQKLPPHLVTGVFGALAGQMTTCLSELQPALLASAADALCAARCGDPRFLREMLGMVAAEPTRFTLDQVRQCTECGSPRT